MMICIQAVSALLACVGSLAAVLLLTNNHKLQNNMTANVCFSMIISQLEEIFRTLSQLNCFCSS